MSQKILLKRSQEENKIPTATDLEVGELAINTFSGKEKLFLKNNNNEIITIDIQEIKNNTGATAVTPMTGSTATISPNIFYMWGSVASLTLQLQAPTNNNILNEYMVQFTSPATPTNLSVPISVKWIIEPEIEANKTYMLSIVNNLGVIGGV